MYLPEAKERFLRSVFQDISLKIIQFQAYQRAHVGSFQLCAAIYTINKVTFIVTHSKCRMTSILFFFTSIYFNFEIGVCEVPSVLFKERSY